MHRIERSSSLLGARYPTRVISRVLALIHLRDSPLTPFHRGTSTMRINSRHYLIESRAAFVVYDSDIPHLFRKRKLTQQEMHEILIKMHAYQRK